MAKKFVIAPSQTSGVLRLFHGSDTKSCAQIEAYGLDYEMAAKYGGGGDFWAIDKWEYAVEFAKFNPANGPPAVLSFEIAISLLERLMTRSPPLVNQDNTLQAYQFLPPSYQIVNAKITSVHTEIIDL